jgi:hypothetical protein
MDISPCCKYGDLAERHVGCQLVLQAVDVDELPVELLLVGVELHKAGGPQLLEGFDAEFQRAAIRRLAIGWMTEAVQSCHNGVVLVVLRLYHDSVRPVVTKCDGRRTVV